MHKSEAMSIGSTVEPRYFEVPRDMKTSSK